jgi:hypothetical protein
MAVEDDNRPESGDEGVCDPNRSLAEGHFGTLRSWSGPLPNYGRQPVYELGIIRHEEIL